MARYSLLFKDTAYFQLMKIGQKNKKSMGRLLNDIINDFLENQKDTGKVKANHCFFCKNPPKFELFGFNGRSLYVCNLHKSLKKMVKRHRPMEKPQ